MKLLGERGCACHFDGKWQIGLCKGRAIFISPAMCEGAWVEHLKAVSRDSWRVGGTDQTYGAPC